MDTELSYLAWLIVVGLVHLIATAQFLTASSGLAYGLSPRDTSPPRPMPVAGARLERAFQNFMQTFPFAAAAILMVHMLGRHNAYSYWGVTLYFWCRIAFIPLYVSGIPAIRTVVWLASVVGILLMLLSLIWS